MDHPYRPVELADRSVPYQEHTESPHHHHCAQPLSVKRLPVTLPGRFAAESDTGELQRWIALGGKIQCIKLLSNANLNKIGFLPEWFG